MSRFPALQSREFRIFLLGQLISLIGTWMQTTVQPYLAYRITNQPFYLGLIGFASALPTLFFTLPAGVWIERMERRKIVIAMQAVMMLQAFLLAILTLTGRIQIWHLFVLALILGTANAIEIPARQAMMSELVGKEGLASAIGLQSTVFNTARVLGPSLAAPFIVLLHDSNGEGWAFFANAISFLFVIASLLFIHPKFVMTNKSQRGNMWQELREGQHYVLQNPLIVLLVFGISIFSIMGFPNIQLIPAFAKDVLQQIGDTEADVAARNSALLSLQGVGALIAAITITFSGQSKRKGLILIAGQLVAGGALIGMALSRSVPLTLTMMALFGWGSVTGWAMTNTVIQLVTPAELRGRVISNMLWASLGLAPFGNLLVGVLAQQFQLTTPVLLGGIICLSVPILINVLTPRIRTVRA